MSQRDCLDCGVCPWCIDRSIAAAEEYAMSEQLPRDNVEPVLDHLRRCDGQTSHCAVISWQNCQSILAELERSRDRCGELACENLRLREVLAEVVVAHDEYQKWQRRDPDIEYPQERDRFEQALAAAREALGK